MYVLNVHRFENEMLNLMQVSMLYVSVHVVVTLSFFDGSVTLIVPVPLPCWIHFQVAVLLITMLRTCIQF